MPGKPSILNSYSKLLFLGIKTILRVPDEVTEKLNNLNYYQDIIQNESSIRNKFGKSGKLQCYSLKKT